MRTVRDLKIVRALSAHRNFARAADELGMSQPSLSRALARLEEAAGVPLFERSRTAVVPRVFAEIVLQRCDALIVGFEDLAHAAELKRNEDERGVRVSVGPFAAEAVGLAGFAAHANANRTFLGRLCGTGEPAWRKCSSIEASSPSPIPAVRSITRSSRRNRSAAAPYPFSATAAIRSPGGRR